MIDTKRLRNLAVWLRGFDDSSSAALVDDAANELDGLRREPISPRVEARLESCRDRASRIVASEIAAGVAYDSDEALSRYVEDLAHTMLAVEREPKRNADRRDTDPALTPVKSDASTVKVPTDKEIANALWAKRDAWYRIVGGIDLCAISQAVREVIVEGGAGVPSTVVTAAQIPSEEEIAREMWSARSGDRPFPHPDSPSGRAYLAEARAVRALILSRLGVKS